MGLQRDEAIAISQTLLELSAKVDRSVGDLMRSGCTVAQLNTYRRLAGRIMGNVYLHMLKPLFDEYPDLQPAQGSNESEAPLNREIAQSVLQLISEVSSTIEDVGRRYRDGLGEQVDEGISELHQAVSDVRDFVRCSHSDLNGDQPR